MSLEIPTVELSEALSVRGARTFRNQLVALLDADGVQLDASKVRFVDAAGLQLLLGFCTAMEQKGAIVWWSGVTDVLRHSANVAGLATTLGIDGADAGG